jgi:hypothetical protein
VPFALAMVAACAFVVETAWEVRGSFAPGEAYSEATEGSLSIPDAQVYGRPKPGAVARARMKTRDGLELYDVTYHVGPDGTRVVPGRPETGPAWRIFGDSYAFGMGLEDGETMAARVQALHPEARVFNHGAIGHGVGDSFLVLRRALRADPATRACALLVIPDDFRRVAVREAFVATEWGAQLPRFEVVDGRPRFRGRAGDSLSLPARVRVDLVRRSRFVRNHTPQVWATQQTLDTVAALVLAMKHECDLRGARFVLVNLPFARESTELGDLGPWLGGLRSRGVHVLDLEPPFAAHLTESGATRDSFMFTPDPHPRPAYAELVAPWIGDALAGPPP